MRRRSVIATIDDLLSTVDSKYTLVHLSAQRAREINAYYHSLGEGLGQYTPPLVEHVDSNKPLSIALEEIATGKIVMSFPGDARQVAEGLLGAETFAAPDAEVVALGGEDQPAESSEATAAAEPDNEAEADSD